MKVTHIRSLLEGISTWLLYVIYTSPLYALLIIFLIRYYDNIKKIFGDILGVFGFLGTLVRKKSITCKIEGNLNLFAKNINSGFNELILPKVKVEFLNDKNIESFINDDQPIIRMNFTRNQSENLVNASMYYVRTALLHKAKPYIEKALVNALDYHLTRKILVDHKTGEAITYFDDHYLLPDLENKYVSEDYFIRLQQIDEAGFLVRLLLKEYKDFGDKIFPNPPRQEYSRESKDFFGFVHALATRIKDEKSQLSFSGENIQIGVILVSRWETYQNYGISPYLKRIKSLAKNNVNTVYFFASGEKHIKILKEIRENLLKNTSFSELSLKSYRYKNRVAVCALYRLDYENMIAQARSIIATAKTNGSTVDAIVTGVQNDTILVDIEGLSAKIPIGEASKKTILDARLYFHIDDELKVGIINCDDLMNIVVSNKGTETDPIELIERQYSADKVLRAQIKKIKDYGLIVELENRMSGFIPYTNATFSRFLKLDSIFKIDDVLNVRPIHFDSNYNNVILTIADRQDPWSLIDRFYKEGDIVETEVCAIEEKRVVCELQPGIEGIIWQTELDWTNQDVNKLGISLGMSIRAKIKRINHERRMIMLSRKEILDNPLAVLFEENKGKVIKGIVTDIQDRAGIELKFINGIKGFVYISEIDWGYVADLRKYCSKGDEMEVKPIAIDTIRNCILASRKALLPNPIEEFKRVYKEGDIIQGTVEKIDNWGALIKIDDRFPKIKGFISKSQLTKLLFVTDVSHLLKPGNKYCFILLSIDAFSQRAILSRKKMFEKIFDDLALKYDDSYSVRVIGKNRDNEFVIENDDKFQGVLISSKDQKISIGSIIEVNIARINKDQKLIELNL